MNISTQQQQLNNFDLLRFIAAVAVIFSHSFALYSGQGDPLSHWSNGLLDFGGLAVATFFTISGYLIAGSFIRRNELMPFFWARILRIFPGLIVAVLFCVLIIGPLNTHMTVKMYFSHPQTYWYLFKNSFLLHTHPWDFLPSVFENNPYPNAVNGSLWTLPLECLLYFILGFIGILGFLTEKNLKIYFVLIVVGALYLLHFNAPLWLLSLHFLKDYLPSICCFILGASLFIYRNKIAINSLFLLGLFCLLWLLPHTYFLSIFYVTFSYTILYLALRLPYISKIFKKYGDVSYGLYIYAFPIQQTLVQHFALANPYCLFLSAFMITFVCAFLSWHFVEKPMLKLKSSLPKRNFWKTAQLKSLEI